VFDLFSTAVSGRLVADGKNGLDLVLTNNGSMALTPGVDNGFAFTGTFTNPGGVLLPGISVTNGARVTGAIINAGALIASGILLAQASLAGSIVNSGVINPLPGANIQAAIQVTGLVSGTGSQPGGITNSGVILKQDSFSSAAVIQPGVPLVSLASGSLGIGIEVHPSPSFTGNLINSGVIHSYVAGILIDGGAAIGGITNTGATYTYGGITFNTLDQFIAGTPTAAFPEGVAVGIRVGSGPLAGGIVNAGSILASVNATNFLADAIGVGVLGSIGDGLGLNTGDLTGINTANRQTLTGDIRNSGTITVRAVTSGTFGLPVAVGIDVAATGLFTGRIINSGVITATATGTNAPTTAAEINQAIADNGGVVNPVVANLLAANIQGRAVGIEIGGTAFNAGLGGAFVGGVTNAGTISASGTGFSNAAPTSGIGIEARVAVEGGITNTGTITGSTAAIATSGGTVVTEAGGVLMGSVLGTASDVLNLTGGAIVLAPGQKIAGFGSFNDTGGTLVLQATPTQAPSVSAGAISLKGPVLVALQGPPQAFFGGVSFRDVFTSGTPISGSFTDARASVGLFAVTLTPDAATANALDVTLRLAPGLTAGDLGESVRFGLQAP
ncbi:MAG TPA: hypothetical protein VKT70_14010, partial [Stellaceae bacterium]|nr:hypothetical protein [Stellaceae bacterium]